MCHRQSDIDRQRDSYYDPIETFVAGLVEHMDEVEYLNFERYIQKMYAGEWFASDTPWPTRATRMLATYIHTTTIIHSLDHYSLWVMEAACKIPARLRGPVDSFNLYEFTTGRDAFHSACGNMMFSYTHPIPKHLDYTHCLGDVDYGFASNVLRTNQSTFKSALCNVEERLVTRGLNYCPISKIYTSTCG